LGYGHLGNHPQQITVSIFLWSTDTTMMHQPRENTTTFAVPSRPLHLSKTMEKSTEAPPVQREEEKAMKAGAAVTKRLAQILLLTHGLGVLLGFYLFYSFYRTQCSALLTASKDEYNNTLSSLQTKCDWNSKRIKDSYEETSTKESLSRQLNLLEQQTALASKHQECLASHETALIRLSAMQQEHEVTTATINKQMEEIKTLKQTIDDSVVAVEDIKRRAEKRQERLQNQLELAKAMLREKVDEVERLKSSSDGAGEYEPAVPSQQDEIVHMQAAVKRRSMAQAVQSFGEAPYTVLFLIKGQNQAATTFEVEFGTLHEMPHTVYTFLKLVQAGLYHETSLQKGEDAITGGSPATSIRKQVQSKLMRRYAELGFGVNPLLFTERSTAPCDQYSFGLVHKGPDFEIVLQRAAADDDMEKYHCPGRVVSGQDTLRGLRKGERITIVDARIIQSTREEL
jgi:hypothetical protein